MENQKPIPHWYNNAEIVEQLTQSINSEIASIDPIETRVIIELKNAFFLSLLFKTHRFEKAILKQADDTLDLFTEIIPKTTSLCNDHIKKYEDLLTFPKALRRRHNSDIEACQLLTLFSDIKYDTLFSISKATTSLAKTFSLNADEQIILEVMTTIFHSENFHQIINEELFLAISDTCSALSIITGIDSQTIEKTLNSDSPLIRFGLLEFDTKSYTQEVFRLGAQKEFLDVFFNGCTDEDWLENWIAPSAAKSCTKIDDYFYIANEVNTVQSLLTAYSDGSLNKPPQILLWGKPGTGKTEFARLCGHKFFKSCYEVPFKDENQSAFDGTKRLQSFNRICHLFRNTPTASLIFDEIEDIIPTDKKDDTNIKAMLNRAIEAPAMPVFWLTNSVLDMDESYLRRFDFIIEFKALNTIDTLKYLNKYSNGLELNSKWVSAFCRNYSLAPSCISDTLNLAKSLNLNGADAEDFIELKVDQFERSANPLIGMGGSKSNKSLRDQLKDSDLIPYDANLSNTNTSLEQLTNNLRQHKDASILCYGPPGTGKTEFAKKLGDKLNKPHEYANASELLNKFVGGTEEKIRNLFGTAQQSDAIVIIDEADSILRSRESADKSWEVTQVNQFLSSIESFEGLCIVCTNFESSLDSALYRRFDLKIQFEYLQSWQAYTLFNQLAQRLNIDMSGHEDSIKQQLDKQNNLVPAYFSLIARRAKFAPLVNNAQALIDLLIDEQKWMQPKSRPIGFIH